MMRDFERFLDVSAKLRRIGLQATMLSMGQEIPPAVAAAMQLNRSGISEKTIEDLDELRHAFVQFARQPPPSIGWPHEPLAQAAESSRLAGFILNAVLRAPARAVDYYSRAKEDFLAAGLAREAQLAESNAATCADTASGNLEGQIIAAREALRNSAAGTLASVQCGLDLGELLLQSKNQWEAQGVLKAAEAGLRALGYQEPPSGRELLTGMMDAIRSTSPASPGFFQAAQQTVVVRLLFYRLYAGLEAAYAPVDAKNRGNSEESARYATLIEKHQLLGKS